MELEQVDAAVGHGELAADVTGGVDVDNAVTAAFGPEHGQVAAVVLGDLGVDARPSTAERADELAGEALPFHPAQPRDHGEPGMEAEAERVGASVNDQPLVAHGLASTHGGLFLSLGSPCWGAFRAYR